MAEWLSLAEAVAGHVHDGDTVAMEGLPTSSHFIYESGPIGARPPAELAVLRDLKARTAAAHGVQGGAA